jgi:hypothetical protein
VNGIIERPVDPSAQFRPTFKPEINPVTLAEFRIAGEAIDRGRHDIVFFAEHFLGMPLHDGQKKFLEKKVYDIEHGRKIKVWLLVPANRWGKSILVAILHIWHNFYKIGIGQGNPEAWSRAAYMTVNLAPHTDATKPVFEAILNILRSSFVIPQDDGSVINNECLIGWWLDESRVRTSTPYVVAFVNNTQILFRSTGEDKGDSIQGKNFGYISYDEGGRSNHLEYELNANIIPRLADLNGSLDIVSTPDMKSNSLLFHFDLFEKGQNNEYGYFSQEGSISDNIFLLRNNPTYIEDETRRLNGDPILMQVLHGKFVFAGDNLYPANDILAAKDEDLTPGIPYQAGHHYAVGVDTAMGQDEMVFTILDVTNRPFKLVRMMACKGNTKSPDIHMADFEALVRSYLRLNNLHIVIETWNGESANFYKMMPYDLQMISRCWGSFQPIGLPSAAAMRMKRIKKAEILLAPRGLLAKGELKLPNDPTLIKQLSIYREDDTNIPTDRVISLALACWLATDGAPKNNNEVVYIDL